MVDAILRDGARIAGLSERGTIQMAASRRQVLSFAWCPTLTVADLVAAAKRAYGFPAQKLTHLGQELVQGRTLEAYGIAPGFFVIVYPLGLNAVCRRLRP